MPLRARLRSIARTLLVWGFALALLLLAWSAHSPWTMRIREVEGVVVFGGALFGVAVLRRQLERGRVLLLMALVVAPVLSVGREVLMARARARVSSAPPEQLARLGAHVVLGYRSVEEVRPLVERGAVAGVFVTQRNVRGRSFTEVQRELASLRSAVPAGRSRLIVAADQEGGLVSRLSPVLTPLPPLSALLTSGGLDEETVRAYARIHARDLARLGVDVNFGPVVDLRLHEGLGLLDAHTQLEDRAISADPALVARVAAIYADELTHGGVAPTLKHFPGLGRVRSDTHLFDATLDAPTALLEDTDWRPYRAMAGRSDVLVMVGHVRVPEVDPEHLSTCSPALLRGVLREQLGFTGPIITDDLVMKPTYEAPGGLGESAVQALGAGVDLLLVAYDPDQYFPLMAALLDAEDAGRLDRGALAASAERIAGRTVRGRGVEVRLAGRARE